MAILGLGSAGATAVKDKKSSKKDSTAKPKSKTKKNDTSASSQEDEAKALLEQMEAKKDADECPFC